MSQACLAAALEDGGVIVDDVCAALGVGEGRGLLDGQFLDERLDVGLAVIDGEASEFGHAAVADGDDPGVVVAWVGVLPEGVVEGLLAEGVSVLGEGCAADAREGTEENRGPCVAGRFRCS